MRRRSALVSALILATLLPAPAAGAGDPYAADPVGLVPFRDTVHQVYSLGVDQWQVWVCRVPGWPATIDLTTVTSDLNRVITPYFDWLSAGRYQPVFTAGGVVTSTDQIPQTLTNPETLFAPGCESAVAAASSGTADGAMILVDAGFDEGYATAGAVCPEAPFAGCATTYPANARRAVLGAATVTTVAPFDGPQWITVAHEIGHALSWAHSYSGLTRDPGTGSISRYDNPMDVMSGAYHSGMPIGTIAYDRYAAGWIDPSQVIVPGEGTAEHRLSGIGSSGSQMIAIEGSGPNRFYVLGVRRKVSYDTGLPRAGVEVYEIDQRPEVACATPAAWPNSWPCFATLTRIIPTPAAAGDSSTLHVLGIDDEVTLGRFTVTVAAADAESVTVSVTARSSGRFLDDDGSPHEQDIEKIAALGFTTGCNPPDNDRYCPTDAVSRAEMAVFLIRALGEESNLGPYRGYFADVPAGDWYTRYVERLYEMGVTTGTGEGLYEPGGPVTRAEMAAFLTRGFFIGTNQAPVGIFADVPIDAWYADEAEHLYALGVTTGCSTEPRAYCPSQPVRRDQMASFLSRALAVIG